MDDSILSAHQSPVKVYIPLVSGVGLHAEHTVMKTSGPYRLLRQMLGHAGHCKTKAKHVPTKKYVQRESHTISRKFFPFCTRQSIGLIP